MSSPRVVPRVRREIVARASKKTNDMNNTMIYIINPPTQQVCVKSARLPLILRTLLLSDPLSSDPPSLGEVYLTPSHLLGLGSASSVWTRSSPRISFLYFSLLGQLFANQKKTIENDLACNQPKFEQSHPVAPKGRLLYNVR